MWDNKLWPPNEAPGPPLVSADGTPADLSYLSDAQRTAMQTWTGGTGYQGQWQNVLNNISDGYELGWLQP
jgi:hypothetical protein